MSDRETLGDRIKKWRLRKGWSQRKLAREAHLDIAWISRLESGERTNISLEGARRIALALGVTTDYLAGTYDESELKAAMQALLGRVACIAGGALIAGGIA